MLKKTLPVVVSFLLLLSLSIHAQQITSFTLINSDTDKDIDTLTEGSSFDVEEIGRSLNIRANTTGTIGSVSFWLDGFAQGTENVAPYAMFGDSGGDYGGSSFSNGPHAVKAIAFSGSGATGEPLDTLSINFTIIDTVVIPTPVYDTIYEEKNGMLNIEAEHLDISGNWTIGSSITGASGGKYIYWTGNEYFNNSSNGHINVEIKINTPGLYLFEWRVAIAKGSSTTEHNDSWLKIKADDFYGHRFTTGSYVHPKPLCHTSSFRCPEGSGTDGFFKIFGGGLNNFIWTGHTSDSDSHKIYVKFEEAKQYSFTIAARSSYHCIDVIKFKKIKNIISSVDESPIDEISIFPNPTNDRLHMDNLSGISNVSILDMNGQQVYCESPENYALSLDISKYSPGIYILHFESDMGKSQVKKFIVE